ncbi:MAG TPA: hypothetical protein VJQ82_09280 [Terriglobales bacterium]|nr:hypothetical protein [Terriglobales bacterium]
MKNWTLPLSLFVAVLPAFGSQVKITTTTLPNGTVGTAYSGVVNASGGCTPYKWVIASGALPPGVTSKASNSTTSLNLTGTPTKANTSSFSVKVTGCGGNNSDVAYKVVIQSTANHVVNLSWKASTTKDVTGYNVYRSPDGKAWSKINASLVGSTLYADSSVSNGSTYYYSTTAVDVYGKESVKSNTVKAIVP